MASISNDKNGGKRIQFIDEGGKRKAIRLGKVSARDALTVKLKVEALLSSKLSGASGVDRDVAAWLGKVDKRLLEKLRVAELLPEEIVAKMQREEKGGMTLKELTDKFIVDLGKTKKPGTVAQWRQVEAILLEILPDGIVLKDITRGHATQYFEKLKDGRASATVFKHVMTSKQFFNFAVDWNYIPFNPFDRLKVSKGNAKNNVEVPREKIAAILSVCDAPWKAIVGLARYGGLRTPSETLSIRWEDIDFKAGMMMVPEPKVEHHEGRGIRECPLFPELREILEPMRPRDGVGFVVNKPAYRAAANTGVGWRNANLRTQFLKKLKKANVEPWARLFHSMRASRQTELLADRFPIHVVCAWLGNSPKIAQKSYLLVTADDISRARGNGAESGAVHDGKDKKASA